MQHRVHCQGLLKFCAQGTSLTSTTSPESPALLQSLHSLTSLTSGTSLPGNLSLLPSVALPSTRISVPLLSGSSPSSWVRGVGQGEAMEGKAYQARGKPDGEEAVESGSGQAEFEGLVEVQQADG